MNMQDQGSRVASIGFEEARSMAALGHSIYHINNDGYRHDTTMCSQCNDGATRPCSNGKKEEAVK
jgi:hypothetical protein